MKIKIIGAGIGGLALGAALQHHGIEFDIHEQRDELQAVGYGLTEQSNALAALDCIHVGDSVRRAGNLVRRAQISTARGRTLVELPVEICAIHRHSLLTALGSSIPDTRIRFGSRVTTADDADWTIAADGVHSAFRSQIAPGEQDERDAKCLAWRGLVHEDSLPKELIDHSRATESWGRGARFGMVPIGAGLVYWFAVSARAAPPRGDPAKTKAHLLGLFGSWHTPLPQLLAETPAESILQSRVTDRYPIGAWHTNRILLLGDAAHPMTPNLGQGGCQAIEDAVVLGHLFAALQSGCLAESELGPRYELLRKTRAESVVEQSYQMGRVGNLCNPLLVALRDLAIRAIPVRSHLRRMKPLLRFRSPEELV